MGILTLTPRAVLVEIKWVNKERSVSNHYYNFLKME